MKFEPLSLILLFAGTDPIYETKRRTWWQKINILGLVLCVVQLSLTIVLYYEELKRGKVVEIYTNNIMRITIVHKRMFTIIIPFIYCFSKFHHVQELELFYSKSLRFDELIRIAGAAWKHQLDFGESVKRVHRINHRLNVVYGVLLIVIEVVNIWIGVFYILRTTKAAPQFTTFYFYQMSVVIFVGAAFYIFIQLKSLKMRIELLLALEGCIVRDITRMELEKRRFGMAFAER